MLSSHICTPASWSTESSINEALSYGVILSVTFPAHCYKSQFSSVLTKRQQFSLDSEIKFYIYNMEGETRQGMDNPKDTVDFQGQD